MLQKAGLSLIEITFVLLIAGILMTTGIVAFREYQERVYRQQVLGQLFHVFSYARTEAIRLGKPLILCPAREAEEGCGENWTAGYQLLEGDRILRTYPAIKGHLAWRGAGYRGNQIIFSPQGVVNAQDGRWTYCSVFQGPKEKAYELIVSHQGRIRYANDNERLYTCQEIE